MRLATVLLDQKRHFGLVEDDMFVDLTACMGQACADVVDLLNPAVAARAREAAQQAPRVPVSGLVFDIPMVRPDMRMFALGLAYKGHQEETGNAAPRFPFFFNKLSTSLVGHCQDLVKPAASDQFDFEGEIVIVIGRGGRDIPAARAAEHIGGYSILMDGSMRDWQKHSIPAGKNFDRSSAFGPWITTAEEISDASSLMLTTRLNGAVVQHAKFSDLVWDVCEVIHYFSTICELRPGDVISTGTPGGVGARRTPPLFMKPGDHIEVEVSGIGVLSNVVR